jgi:uncharacterized HAD superfamily protein
MSEKKIVERGAIAWDLDDTCCHFMAPALKALQAFNGRKVTPEECVNSMWLNDFLTKDELDRFLPTIFNPAFYMKLEPTAIFEQRHTREFAFLHQQFDFHAVTARRFALGRLALRITSDWLHLQEVQMDGITICHPDQPKTQVLPANTLAVVDDSASVCKDAAARGLKVFLVDRPWNRHLDVSTMKNVHRVTHATALKRMADELLS